MTEGVLDFGEVAIPNWQNELSIGQRVAFKKYVAEYGIRDAFMLADINYVRTWVRKQRYGETGAPEGYSVEVTWPDGQVATWEFDATISWPKEDGEERDWHGDWMKIYGR